MVEKKPKGSGQSKDSLKNTKALNLNTKAAKANSKQLQSLTKKLGSSFTSLNSTMKSSGGKVTKAIGTNTKSISTNTKSLKGLSKAITSLTQSNTKGKKKTPIPKPVKDEDKTPKPKPGKDEDKTPKPKPGKDEGKTPTPPVIPPVKPVKPVEPPEDPKKDEGLSQNIGLQTAVMGKLTGALMSLWAAQGDMVKTFHRFGKQNMIGFSQMSKTMGANGLSFEANLAVHSEMFNAGLGEYNRSLGTYTDGLSQPKLKELQVKTLAEFKNLGLNSKALAGFLSHNSQVIGGSASKSIALADKMASLGVTYGISTDKLVSALQNLSETFMKSANIFGADVAQAGQEAIASMISKMGVGQQANIEKMARTLLNGTKEAAIAMEKLGIDRTAVASGDPAQIERALMVGFGKLDKMLQGSGPDDALWMNDLNKAVGSNDAILSIARHSAQLSTKQININLAKAAADAVAANAQANIDQMIKDSIRALLPAIEKISFVLNKVAKIVGALSHVVSMILLQMMARKAGKMLEGTGTKMKQAMPSSQKTINNMEMKGNSRFQSAESGKFVSTKAGKAGVLSGKTKLVGGSAAQKLKVGLAKSQMKAAKFGAKLFAKLGGKMIGKLLGKILFKVIGGLLRTLMGPIGIILSFIPDILGMFGIKMPWEDEAEKDRKKTNELLTKPSKQETQLAGIARMLTQSNIYAEKANLTADQTLEATKDNKVDPNDLPQNKPSETLRIPFRGKEAVAQ
jgi:hypothetical protein